MVYWGVFTLARTSEPTDELGAIAAVSDGAADSDQNLHGHQILLGRVRPFSPPKASIFQGYHVSDVTNSAWLGSHVQRFNRVGGRDLRSAGPGRFLTLGPRRR